MNTSQRITLAMALVTLAMALVMFQAWLIHQPLGDEPIMLMQPLP